MAIDRKAILAAVYQGAGMAAKNLIPPTVAGFDTAVPDFRYDPPAAKKLLEAAGLKDGFATDLWAMPVQRPYDPDGKHLAELVQADLAKVGVKATIVTDAWDEYRRRALAGEAPLAELGWIGDNGDADNFFTPLAGCAAAAPGGSNIARWCDKDFDALIARAAAVPDSWTRARLYQQAQVILHKQAPYMLIAHSLAFVATTRNVIGYRMDPLGMHEFAGADLR
jgi:dipeptide transport system substrate-binding protein